ncbi:MAG: tetratricopeptide repeat protein [Thermoanaerobaculia bacterium]
MSSTGRPPFRASRADLPTAGFVAAFLLAVAGGCASAPPPAAAVSADAPFAFRDPREGAPSPAPTARESKALDAALAALRRGDAATASRALVVRRGEVSPALRLARAYLDILEGRRDEARTFLADASAANPAWTAVLEAGADLAADEGETSEALEAYQALLRLVPSDARTRARVETLRASLAASKRAAAEEALAAGDLDAARRHASSLLQLEAESAAALVLLSRTASAGGRHEDAWTWAREARRRAPADPAVAAFAGDAAAKAGRWADAATLYEEAASSDPSSAVKAEEARREFKVQNLPEAARAGAESARLTRAQLASLLWWTVPEFREALVPPGTEIAVDVVGRPDQGPLVKAIGLGILDVSPETHRVGTETAVSRVELAAALRQVALLAGRGRPPKGCLSAADAASLADCGILGPTPSRNVTGREALRAMEKAARIGREGGTR